MSRDFLRSLETQAVVIGIFVILLSCLGLFSVLRYLVIPGFTHLGEQQAQQNILRINNGIKRELQVLNILALDWASRDDTVSFVETGNDGYIQINLAGDILENLDLHYLQFLTLSGESRWLGRSSLVPFEDVATITALNRNLLQSQFSSGDEGVNPAVSSGVVAVADKPFLLSAYPVVGSTEEGPLLGMLLMGKFVDIDELQERLLISFSFEYLARSKLDSDTADILRQIHTSSSYSIGKKEKDTLVMHSIVEDITGKEAFLLSTNYPRHISGQALDLIEEAMAFSIVGALVLIAMLLLWLNRIIFTPVQKLTVHVRSVIKSQDYGSRTCMDRKDEIGILARTFDRLLVQMGSQTMALLEANKMLEKSSLTDALTGIANRRQLDLSLEQAWQHHIREHEPLTMIMCDIDHFKLYNDTYGHDRGDTCLKIVSRMLSGALHRPSDVVSRYGGEEFVLLLPNTNTAGGELVAANISKALFDQQIEHSASPTLSVVTISMGIATLIPDGKEDRNALLKAADQALYAAKEGGRNQVCCSSHACVR